MSTVTAASPALGTRTVLDASAVVRALAYDEEEAQRWLSTVVSWPTLIYAEVGHVVLRLHRQQRLLLDDARRSVQALHRKRADAHRLEGLTPHAWNVALERNLTVYDACYVVLAEALDVPLVTADRPLAAATPNAVLLS